MTRAEGDRWPEGREVHIVVPGEISGWKRTGKGLRGHRYTPHEMRSYLEKLSNAAADAMAGEDPIPRAVGVELDLLGVWPVPGWSGRKTLRALNGEIHKTTGPDIDNGMIKGVMDALQHVVFSNDAQVIALGRSMKVYGTRPRLEVWITVAGPLTEHDHPKLANKARTETRLHDPSAEEQSSDLFLRGSGN